MLTPEIGIVYEDDVLLIINKPAGITVNRSETTVGEVTVQDWVEDYLKVPRVAQVSRVSQEENNSRDTRGTFDTRDTFYDRSGIVHRIDKETSGILLIAKTPGTFSALQAQFKERTVKKTYVALAHGKITPEKGEIHVPVGRLPWNRRSFGIVAGGREAVTVYTVIALYRTRDKRKEIVSLVELNPLTGRTHQIRVHLQYLGHPIFSDFLYAGRKTQREDRKVLGRVFLHAAKISFIHPRTSKQITFEAPLPSELQEVIDQLERVQ